MSEVGAPRTGQGACRSWLARYWGRFVRATSTATGGSSAAQNGAGGSGHRRVAGGVQQRSGADDGGAAIGQWLRDAGSDCNSGGSSPPEVAEAGPLGSEETGLAYATAGRGSGRIPAEAVQQGRGPVGTVGP